ncbi:MAG: substrate-binding periplasmic protein [Saccharospirillum sp.]
MTVLFKAVITVFLLAFSAPLIAKETVRIAIGEWPPYLSRYSPHYGVAAHIVQEAFQASDMNVEFHFFPWARVLVYIENGEYDASILWVKTEERENSLIFSDIVLEGEAVFFYNKDNPLIWQNVEDLSNKRFGGLLSASYPWFDAARSQGVPMEMELVTTEQQNFSKLLTQRIDAYAMDRLVGMNILQQNFPDRKHLIAYDTTPIETWPYRLIFTKNAHGEALASAFNQGLDIIKQHERVQIHLNNVANGVYLPQGDE